MSVEIAIISGAQKGERIHLDRESFEIGGESVCAVYFDPSKDPTIAGRRVRIALGESGWQIQNSGSGLVRVNQTIVDDATRLRSGDIIRMSDMGPDLLFTLVSSARGTTVSREQGEIRTREGQSSWVAIGLGLLIGCIAFILLAILTSSLMRPQPPSQGAVEPPNESLGALEPERDRPPEEVTTDSVDIESRLIQDPTENSSNLIQAPQDSTDPGSMMNDRVAAAVCLITAVEPRTGMAFPYGTACAIRDDALLTNGLLAVELRKRMRDGWQVWAEWPVSGERRPIADVRVHQGLAATGTRPSQETIYWDLAILLLQGQVEHLVDLATPTDLANLKSGCQLWCVVVPHDGEPLTRFDDATVQVYQGTLFDRSTLSIVENTDTVGAPLLLHLQTAVPNNSYGGLVLNDAGKVIAVYAERAHLPDTESNEQIQIHYAPVVTLAYAWLKGQGVDHWVASE